MLGIFAHAQHVLHFLDRRAPKMADAPPSLRRRLNP